jgi:hypothetical protein
MKEIASIQAALDALDSGSSQSHPQLLRRLRKVHLQNIKDLYQQFKTHVEVLERAVQKNPPYKFSVGEEVFYIPDYANGDVNHPNVERGTVSSVSDSTTGGHQNVWVRYTEGITGAKTAWDMLVPISAYNV